MPSAIFRSCPVTSGQKSVIMMFSVSRSAKAGGLEVGEDVCYMCRLRGHSHTVTSSGSAAGWVHVIGGSLWLAPCPAIDDPLTLTQREALTLLMC